MRLSLPTLALSLLIPSVGWADGPVCAPRDQMLTQLTKRFGELPSATGLTAEGSAMLVYATPDGSTFTLVFVGTNGIACMAAAGTGWDADPIVSGRAI